MSWPLTVEEQRLKDAELPEGVVEPGELGRGICACAGDCLDAAFGDHDLAHPVGGGAAGGLVGCCSVAPHPRHYYMVVEDQGGPRARG